jgi:excisionase family DNA binding protein
MATTTIPAGRGAVATAPTRSLSAKWDGRDTFTVEEFAEIFGLSRPSAYAATSNGTVPTIRIGRRLIISRRVVERLLDA